MATEPILVVEDSPMNLRLIKEVLENEGYSVLTAVDGEQALQMAIEHTPPLMILDIILPKKNGFQVCRQIKTSPATQDIKIIMLTSKSQDSDRFWGLKQGADEYMTKPFDNDELLKNVKKLLSQDPES